MRPLRSVMIGDLNYFSEYIFGVNQAMTLLGHFHTHISIRDSLGLIERRLREVQPDIIFSHMLLWPPPSGEVPSEVMAISLLSLCQTWHDRGVRIVIHDGDARPETRFPYDISTVVDLALCNHTSDRSAWGVKQLRWPYFAFVQESIAAPVPDFSCDLGFAGRRGGRLYVERDRLLDRLQRRLGERFKTFPSDDHAHTLFRTPELAASATAMLGYGRADAPGWLDVRCFLIPGAGGVLLHDDVGGFLEPYIHYIPYRAGDTDSIVEGIIRARELGPAIRPAAFAYVQEHHSSIARVREALRELDLERRRAA